MPISISLMQDNFTKMFLKEILQIGYNLPEFFLHVPADLPLALTAKKLYRKSVFFHYTGTANKGANNDACLHGKPFAFTLNFIQ